MNKTVVTGAAGFIGSTLAEALIARSDSVVGIDCLTDSYDQTRKRANLAALVQSPNFEFVPADLCVAELEPLIVDADTVFHHAAQPGVRDSWSGNFDEYARDNILATHRLLEALRHSTARLVHASSSSVYGNAALQPTPESHVARPSSPYGVTKLAAEGLCSAYAENWGVPVLMLRYFSVYGPRQRPDMAIHRVIEAGLNGTSFPIFGDGSARRDAVFVEDVADACLRATASDWAPGAVVNIGGGNPVTLSELLDEISGALAVHIDLDQLGAQAGDVASTSACIELAGEILGWEPSTPLADGLAAQISWHHEARHA